MVRMDSPKFGTVELTHRCNFNCIHCYNPADRKIGSELTTKQWIEMFRQFNVAGVRLVTLTGGEVFVRKDFCELYLALINSGIKVIIETNASILNERVYKMLDKYPPAKFYVSVYGLDQKTFGNFTRTKLNFEKVLNHLKLLKKIDSDMVIRACLTSHNFHILPEVIEFAEELGIPFGYGYNMFITQDGRRDPSLRCKSKDILPYAKNNPHFAKLYESLKFEEEHQPVAKKSCNWGTESFYMDPYGDMYHCNVFWSTKASALKLGFMGAWTELYSRTRRKKGNYCLAKNICNSGGDCPVVKLQLDVEDDLSLSLADRYRAFIKEKGEGFSLEEIGINREDSEWLQSQK